MSLWAARGVRIGCVLLATAVVITCVQTETDRCDDGSVCPDNTQCRAVTNEPPLMTCVTEAQLDACIDIDDGKECAIGGNRGTCLGSACYRATCGDRIVDLSENCDDGNTENLDGCSATCDSLERCGDGLVDLLRSEQCDDAGVGLGLSGDGCSSSCLSELDLWQPVLTKTPAPRIGASIATDPMRGVLMFGGTLGSGSNSAGMPPENEMWRWNASAWRELTPPHERPSPRVHAAISFDPLRRRIVMFGGSSAGNFNADLWEWDGYTWTERTTSLSPPPRERASMACSPGRCVLVGGMRGPALLGDVWSWDGTTWTELTGTLPSARSTPGMAYDSDRNLIVLFGGQGAGGALSDTWELGAGWTEIQNLVPRPPSSLNPVAAYHAERRVVVLTTAGQTWTYDSAGWRNLNQLPNSPVALAYDTATRRVFSLGYLNDVSHWDGSWSPSPSVEPQSSLSSTSYATFDREKGRTILVDGYQTFAWDGVAWSTLVAAALRQPPSVVGAAIAFDRPCHQAVHVGGGSGSGVLRETWTLDDTWRLEPGALTARLRHAMTYDEMRDAIVVFGGTNTNGTLGDTWERTGPCGAKVWTQRTPASGPGPRAGVALAYDPVRHVSVMFGGVNGTTVLDETWEWDGDQWRARAIEPTDLRPPRRSDHALAYDPRRRAVILFGGRSGTAVLNDTWQWDGTAWSRIGTLVSPPKRNDVTMTEDPTGNLILLGGRPFTVNAGVWRLQSSTAFDPTESCQLATADQDGDKLHGCADPDCGPRCRPLCVLGESCTGPHCGDGACSAIEDHLLCPGDCPAP